MNAELVAMWRTLAPDACLDTEELSRAFGISLRAIHSRVEVGTLPQPAFLGGKRRTDGIKGWNSNGTRGVRMTHKNKWRVRDILRYIDSQPKS